MANFRWTERANFGPGARAGMAMAYDSVRSVTVMFGGAEDSGYQGDTWEWNGKQWVQASDMGPSVRFNSQMVFAADEKVCVLFGGLTKVQSAVQSLGDTWVWDGRAWTELLDSGPEARYLHGMAFDSSRNRVVLFGGVTDNGLVLGDTWEFDGQSWTEQTATEPLGRFGMSMAYDDVGKRVVLFGGIDANNKTYGDTWTWDGQRWVQIAHFGPTARWSAAMSGGEGSVVLMGGVISADKTQAPSVDTWQLSGNLWKQLENFGPGPLSGAASVVDTGRGVVVLFGGMMTASTSPVAFSGNTWEAMVPTSVTPTLAVQSVTLQIQEGQLITGITLNGPAPAGGVSVNVSLTKQGQTVAASPVQLSAQAGQTAVGTFTFTPSPGTYTLTAQIPGTPVVSGSVTV